ncbi:MAG: hypothetical protein ACRDWY_01445 [Actinomycetes bacterium]
MARHTVRMRLPGFDIRGSNAEFVIYSSKTTRTGRPAKLGELHVSQGSLEWWPKGAKQWRREVKWEKFAAWIEQEGTRT